jgi:hypothetical protein
VPVEVALVDAGAEANTSKLVITNVGRRHSPDAHVVDEERSAPGKS